MGCRVLCVGGLLAALLPVLYVVYELHLKSPPPLPQMQMDAWWGPKEINGKQDTSVKPFYVSFSQSMVSDLKQRLKNHRKWTPPLEGVGFQYGFNSQQLDGWVKYWAEQYNFTAQERFLNQFPQFKTNIQGLDVHFIRVTPQVPAGVAVVPMLLLHGWPGSVREFYEALPLLTAASQHRDFAVEAIVPSLPGYGFSDAAVRPGLGAAEIGVVFRNLMHRLGYKKYYVHGGDWGALIGSSMATLFPDEVLGFHVITGMTNSCKARMLMLLGAVYPPLVVEPHLAERIYPISSFVMFALEEFGYLHLQATKPDTVGVALSDSPAGLLAYILEKFSTWTRKDFRNKEDGGLGLRWSKDQLLDNLMLYWSTGSITTSMRLYSETLNKRHMAFNLDEIPTPVPTWILQPKHDLGYQPPIIQKTKYNVVGITVADDGGHFISFELPKFFVADLLKAVGEFRRIRSVRSEL